MTSVEGVLAPYRPVLAVPGAGRLFAGALIARLPQGMTTLAVLLLVRGATHSYAAAGGAVGAEALAAALGAPPLGRLVDRFGRVRVLTPCAVLYPAGLIALVVAAALHAGAPVLIAITAVGGAALPPVAPVVRALMGEVFREVTVRERAYALEAVAQELVWIAGPLLIGLVIAFCSPSVAVLLIAAESALGAALFIRTPLVRARRQRAPVPGRLGAVLGNRALRALLVPIALTGAALGATEVGLPALALHAGSRSASGLLLAMWSVGSMAGGLWFGGRAWRASLWTRYGALLVLAVGCIAPLIAARSILAGVGGTVLAGLTIAPVFSCQYALVGEAVEPGRETEAFTWVSAALVAGIAGGSALGGGLVSAAGFSAPFVFACAMMAAAALSSLAAHGAARRGPRRAGLESPPPAATLAGTENHDIAVFESTRPADGPAGTADQLGPAELRPLRLD